MDITQRYWIGMLLCDCCSYTENEREKNSFAIVPYVSFSSCDSHLVPSLSAVSAASKYSLIPFSVLPWAKYPMLCRMNVKTLRQLK